MLSMNIAFATCFQQQPQTTTNPTSILGRPKTTVSPALSVDVMPPQTSKCEQVSLSGLDRKKAVSCFPTASKMPDPHAKQSSFVFPPDTNSILHLDRQLLFLACRTWASCSSNISAPRPRRSTPGRRSSAPGDRSSTTWEESRPTTFDV
eukprot:CAMPEP_0172563506 /NCGR_PEP_ID=MMETSP1067-20121228/100937_1 /TAXON_ID=265564 ORGANISM="Thalassiosira punctigera, Strain Tpunct2005C2" /NCGR_SAMPLE_ID=MMETSP1067 /ASSEMBLY_ACC=CAM_ASM_000444 /LENGTH=148 /DNA_ID=CAMNT_0013353967 /DNA_START=117 /DNA_END=561 /DNA_ORIENTATION=+